MSIGMEISTACNRHCWYCPQREWKRKQQIVSDDMWLLFLQRLEEFKWCGLTMLHLYNELSLVPESLRYVRDLSKLGTLPFLFSNGDRPSVVEDWIKAGAYKIVVTQHPPTTDKWKIEMESLKKRYPRHIRLQMLKQSDLRDVGGRIPEIKQTPLKHCFMSHAMNFSLNGNAGLCCIDADYQADLGNIKTKTISDIWYSNKYRNMRKATAAGNPAIELCQTCFGTKSSKGTP
jgi:sulfatase maturation enzyme AslB (radical SAM superfamily)